MSLTGKSVYFWLHDIISFFHFNHAGVSLLNSNNSPVFWNGATDFLLHFIISQPIQIVLQFNFATIF